jgi:hypothetical protein
MDSERGESYTLSVEKLSSGRDQDQTVLIMVCFNDWCRLADQNDAHVFLKAVENLLADESDEAAEGAVAGLHEVAVNAGAAAAAAASSTAVARGRVASPPAVIAELEVMLMGSGACTVSAVCLVYTGATHACSYAFFILPCIAIEQLRGNCAVGVDQGPPTAISVQ